MRLALVVLLAACTPRVVRVECACPQRAGATDAGATGALVDDGTLSIARWSAFGGDALVMPNPLNTECVPERPSCASACFTPLVDCTGLHFDGCHWFCGDTQLGGF